MRPTLLILIALASTGCSTFERDWEALLASPPTEAVAPDPAGLWEGTWLSNSNGHDGTLRCILEHVQNDEFTARYKATYAGWLTFGYTMSMTVRHEADIVLFAGEADLGSMFGGVYTYDGQITREEFTSSYKAKADHGIFEMNRRARISKLSTIENDG